MSRKSKKKESDLTVVPIRPLEMKDDAEKYHPNLPKDYLYLLKKNKNLV